VRQPVGATCSVGVTTAIRACEMKITIEPAQCSHTSTDDEHPFVPSDICNTKALIALIIVAASLQRKRVHYAVWRPPDPREVLDPNIVIDFLAVGWHQRQLSAAKPLVVTRPRPDNMPTTVRGDRIATLILRC